MPVPDTGSAATQGGTAPAGGESTDGGLVDISAGLDALDTPSRRRRQWRPAPATVLPPLVAVAVVVGCWQLLWAAAFWPEFRLPAPAAVAGRIWDTTRTGEVVTVLWTSVHRGAIGFVIAVLIATPLGLVLVRARLLRTAVGPLLTGLQSMPSVAWVPAAVLWFGLTPTTIYAVVLLGSVPSIANGLVSGVDQIPPMLIRAGRAMGAGPISGVRYILLPAALPGYLAGCRQGWAFSWRSLMAAELIARSPQLGTGLGQTLQDARSLNDMTGVLAAMTLILVVGVVVELVVFRPLERRVLRSRGLAAAGTTTQR